MSDFDPTTNEKPFGLLTEDEQKAMKDWPHGWESYDGFGWAEGPVPDWAVCSTYRGKPSPISSTVQYKLMLSSGTFVNHRGCKTLDEVVNVLKKYKIKHAFILVIHGHPDEAPFLEVMVWRNGGLV